MRNIMLLVRRELGAYLKSPMGYIIVAAVLAINGIFFNAFALGGRPKFSFEVLRLFFYFSFGTSLIASIFLSMRLIAEDRQSGTLTLLLTSPIRDHEIVLGKFLSAWLFFAMMTLLSIYMPLLIFVNGKVSFGHIFSGYLGLLLVGAAAMAVGIFGSSIAKNQLIAVVTTAALVVLLIVFWLVAQISDPPIKDIAAYLALYNKHFINFERGVIHTRDIAYYLSVTYVFLLLTTHVLQARRWR
jgi:ABC-2 type transport system permease protein